MVSSVAVDAIKYLTPDQISTVFLIHFCTQVRYAVTEQQLSIIDQNCSNCTFGYCCSRKPAITHDPSLLCTLSSFLFVQQNWDCPQKIWEMRISGHIQKFKHTHTLRAAGDSGKGGGLFVITKTGHTHSPLHAHPHTHKGRPFPSPWLHFWAPLKSFLETQEKLWSTGSLRGESAHSPRHIRTYKYTLTHSKNFTNTAYFSEFEFIASPCESGHVPHMLSWAHPVLPCWTQTAVIPGVVGWLSCGKNGHDSDNIPWMRFHGNFSAESFRDTLPTSCLENPTLNCLNSSCLFITKINFLL